MGQEQGAGVGWGEGRQGGGRGGRQTHVGVQLADEAGEVVVLEVEGQEVTSELGWPPYDETAGEEERERRCKRLIGGMGAVAGLPLNRRRTHLWPSAPQEITGSVMGSSTMS